MAIEPIDPVDDSRVTHHTTSLNGRNYHYILGVPPNGNFKATVFLIHGWPDLSIGWRYQIPFLINLGFRVVAPDLMGFGGTDAPKVPPASIHLYGFKRASDDISELARQLGAKQIILGGHDWGGAVVWRCALWHPELISHVFAVCTPYAAPSKRYMSAEDVVQRQAQFGYQIHLAGPEVEAAIQTPEQLKQFLNGIYGGEGPNGELAFIPEKGIQLEDLPKIGKSRLLSDKMLNYYVNQYSRNGMHGTLNWYRTRKANFEDEKELIKPTIDVPTLFIQANYDNVLTPALSKGMGRYLPNLTRGEVQATHWALTEKPDEVNAIIKDWLEKTVPGFNSSL